MRGSRDQAIESDAGRRSRAVDIGADSTQAGFGERDDRKVSMPNVARSSPHFSHLRVQMPRFRCGARRIGGHTAMAECTAASARFAALARSLRRSRRCSSSPWHHHVSSSRLALVAKPCAIFHNRCEKCGFRTIFLHAGARYRRSLSVPGLDLIRIN